MLVTSILLALCIVAVFSVLSITLNSARRYLALDEEARSVNTIRTWLQVNQFPLNDDGTMDPDVIREDGMPCLIYALKENQEIADLLLRFGANPNIRTEDGTPAIVAVANDGPTRLGITSGLAMLMEYHPDVNAMDEKGRTALFYAVQRNVQTILLEAGALVNARDIHGKTPLFYTQHWPLMEVLLKNGADPNVQDSHGKTVLFYLNPNNGYHREIAKFLCEEYACESRIRDNAGNCAPIVDTLELKRFAPEEALETAISHGNSERVASLLRSGANPNARGANGKALLCHAVASRDSEILKCMLEAGGDPNREIDDDTIDGFDTNNPVAEALYSNNYEAFQMLLNYGAVLNCSCINKMRFCEKTPRYLWTAARAPSAYQMVEKDVFDLFMNYWSSEAEQNSHHRTALHYLAANMELSVHRLEDCIRTLVRKGADINAADDTGRTPLFYARCSGAVRVLCKYGAKPEIRDHRGRTPLFYVPWSYWNAGDVVQGFLDAGIERNTRDQDGNYALIVEKLDRLLIELPLNRALDEAVDGDDLDLARRALVDGANPHWRHSAQPKWNMLMLAISRKSIKMVSLLLDYGADPNDYVAGETAFQMAIVRKDNQCIKLFIQSGVVPDATVRQVARRLGISLR